MQYPTIRDVNILMVSLDEQNKHYYLDQNGKYILVFAVITVIITSMPIQAVSIILHSENLKFIEEVEIESPRKITKTKTTLKPSTIEEIEITVKEYMKDI